MEFRPSIRAVLTLAGLLCAAAPAAARARAPKKPAPGSASPPVNGAAPTAAESEDDPSYLQVLKAYRGQLSREELDALEEKDPASAMYRELKSEPRRAIVRLFASLPDDRHRELRETGYLKWPVSSLPPEQQRAVREMAKELEGQGEGPFPTTGKTGTVTGFARIDMDGLPDAQYSWWIYAPGCKRPAWITVVRVVGLLLQVHFTAHEEQLKALLDQPDSAPVPSDRWLRIKEAALPPPSAKAALFPEEEYRAAVRAYRGELRGKALDALIADDPLIGRRLRTSDPADEALNRLFARLTEKEHQELLTTGHLVWHTPELSKERRKLLGPVIERLNRQAREGGEGREPFSLIPHAPTYFGFAIIQVPGEGKPVVSWWIKSTAALLPSWVPLVNGRAAHNPAYYRAHLEALAAE